MKRLVAFCLLLGVVLCLSAVPVGARDEKKEVNVRNYEVRITDKFDQKDIEVQVGDTITWTNFSPKKHSVTADEGSELTPVEIVVESRAFSDRVKFEKKGKLAYHCKYHPAMTGTVTVK